MKFSIATALSIFINGECDVYCFELKLVGDIALLRSDATFKSKSTAHLVSGYNKANIPTMTREI